MNRILLILLLLSTCYTANAKKENINDLYIRLDKKIDSSELFIQRHESLIKNLRYCLSYSKHEKDKYHYCFLLYDAYKSYQNDSALNYLKRCRNYARIMKREDLESECLSLMAFQCSTVGYNEEALQLLTMVRKNGMSKKQLTDYYKAYNHAYSELAYYSVIPELADEYRSKAGLYRDSAFTVINKNSQDYMLLQLKEFYDNHDFKHALIVNNKWLKSVKEGSHDYAIMAYYRYLIYNSQGHTEEAKIWLAKSALCDIENAVLDQASLLELANIISNEDSKMDRAYKYISYSWKVAGLFDTKVRSSQISPILRVIDNKYQDQIRSANRELFTYIIIVSFLAILSLILTYYINKQRHKVSKVKDNIQIINKKLESANNQLNNTNAELDERNKELANTINALSISNKALNESNKVKEAYIGRFLRLCSLYVDKLDSMRKKVNKMVKNHQIEELYEMTRSSDHNEKDINELYTYFDEAFLQLFPNFADDFNELLIPKARINLTEDRHMPVVMRIFALIRLGFDDSSKIAVFLHYSVNTIYKYSAKIKNSACVNREDFEKLVKNIGMNEKRRT
nr:transcriptional regulator [Prevotella sp.]